MSGAILLVVGAAAICFFFVLGKRARSKTLVVKQPRWGQANFLGTQVQPQIEEDSASLVAILGEPLRVDFDVPRCDVAFIYARVHSDGTLENSSRGLRELIRDSGAVVVVVAADNPGEAYITAGGRKSYGHANLVMTLRRNGGSFGRFFASLFSKMRAGVSMPVAWVELAPQHAALQSDELPETIFSCEIRQLAFGPGQD